MKVLVTGAGGFVGQHLLNKLLMKKNEVVAINRKNNIFLSSLDIPVYETDILDFDTILNCMKKEKPDVLIHLAAQSNVGISWNKPILTASTNIEGSLNLYKVFFEVNPNGKFINIGSSDEYGLTAKLGIPLVEEMECKPQNPYSISKYCTEQMILQLAKKDKVNVVSTRSFNHFGPGQNTGFVISDFASQVAKIKKGLVENKIFVGDLSASRDFLYIDDVVDAYIKIAENKIPNGVYNISSGIAIKIEYILNKLIEISNMNIKVIIDKNKFRPAEVKKFIGNSDKLKELVGWKPTVNFDDGLEKTLNYWINN